MEEFTITVKTDGVLYYATCEQEFGVHVCGDSLDKCLASFAAVLPRIRELNKTPNVELRGGPAVSSPERPA